MKKLNTTPITDTAQFPVKKGTLEFLQLAHREVSSAILMGLIGNSYNPNTVYIIYGCVNSGTFPNYSITQGAAFYQGEVFLVDSVSFTATGSNVAVFNISTTQYTDAADPVTFTDSTVKNVHDIRKISISAGVSHSGIANYSQAFFLNFYIPEQVSLTGDGVTGAYPNYVVAGASGLNPVLTAGSVNIGDVLGRNWTMDVDVAFATALTTASYYVVGTIISNGDPGSDTEVFWTVRNRSTAGFTIHFREINTDNQNIIFDYIIFKK